MNLFRVQIHMEVELYVVDQATANEECRCITEAMENTARAKEFYGKKRFTKIGLATAHAMIQG